jgi:hypothetical protein
MVGPYTKHGFIVAAVAHCVELCEGDSSNLLAVYEALKRVSAGHTSKLPDVEVTPDALDGTPSTVLSLPSVDVDADEEASSAVIISIPEPEEEYDWGDLKDDPASPL